MQGTCQDCKYWSLDVDWCSEITQPIDPDTFESMDMPFEVRECTNPRLLFCERPVEPNQAALEDGSGYRANLFTGPLFGCTDWESLEEVNSHERIRACLV